jgi:hypothetical protein
MWHSCLVLATARAAAPPRAAPRREQQTRTFKPAFPAAILTTPVTTQPLTRCVMRKPFASLVLLSFLAAIARTAAPASHVAGGMKTGSANSPSATQPSLPGHLTAFGSTAPSVLLEGGSADTWRTHARSHRLHAGASAARTGAADARTCIARLQRSHREFRHTLARARSNVPATLGNPPPSSPT